MSNKDENILKYMEFYDNLLNLQVDFLSDKYEEMFKHTSEIENAELYKTFYCKTKLKDDYVYFIHNKCTGLIKIGTSNDPLRRCRSISSNFKTNFGIDDCITLLGIKFVPSGKGEIAEKLYHDRFSEHRKHGEWFDIPLDFILTEVLFGDIYCGFKVDFDTDNILPNEGFINKLSYEIAEKKTLFVFALDTLDHYTMRIANNNTENFLFIKKYIADNICEKYGYSYSGFLGRDVRSSNTPFSYEDENLTWEIFKWLYLHQNEYALSSQRKINILTGDVAVKILGFGNDCKVLTSSEIIEEYLFNKFLKG